MYFQECSNIFSKGGGEELAKLTGSIFLGKTERILENALHLRGHEVSFGTPAEWPASIMFGSSGGAVTSQPHSSSIGTSQLL